MKLSILVPVYNEEYTVDDLLQRVLAVSLPAGVDREVIVVEDCSTDNTRKRLQEFVADKPLIKLVLHEKNQGKGAAIRSAVQHATGDIVVIQDADLEYDPADYTPLLEPILDGDADVVYGSRFTPSSRKRVLFFWHSLGNRMLTLLSNLFTDLNLTDMETCYKMVRADVIKSIPIRSNRFGIEPELTAKFAKRGCRIYEVPISYRGRSYHEGKKITWKDGIKALGVIFWFWLVDDLYNEQYGHAILHQMSGAHRFNGWMADAIRPWIGQDVLEIGAGLGNLSMKLLPRQSYTVSDVDPLYLQYLRNFFGNKPKVHVAEIDVEKDEHFAPLRERFDTVLCLNVIEHVKDDLQAMKNLFAALKPGGCACILVPRNPKLFGTLDEALGHVRRYTEDELVEKLRSVGFAVEKTFTFNKTSVPMWYINGRILKHRTFSRIQLKIFDSLIFLVRRVDRFLPWKGLSVIAIARKPSAG